MLKLFDRKDEERFTRSEDSVFLLYVEHVYKEKILSQVCKGDVPPMFQLVHEFVCPINLFLSFYSCFSYVCFVWKLIIYF